MKLKYCLMISILLSAYGLSRNLERPNILFIHMEDMGCEIPVYGDMTQATPSLSQLASQGMVFERVNVTAPSCAPSRASLFTGLYPHQNGMWAFDQTHGFHFREGVPTFIQALKKAGYATGISYKTGVEPASAVPFDRQYKYNKNALGKDPGSYQVSNCIDGFQHFLENLSPGEKFYFQAQTNDTHTQWAPKFEPIRGFKTRFGFHPIDADKVKALPHWGKVKMNSKARQNLAEYYGAIQRVDFFVKEILALLEKFGHTENTIVIFSSDHGPSDLFRGKTSSYEFGLRVPFIVKWPNYVKKGSRSNALVSFVDLMPTFLDLAKLPIDEYLPGKSIIPILTGDQPMGHRRFLYSAYNSHTTSEDLLWPARTINDGRYKLIYNLLAEQGMERLGKHGINHKINDVFTSTEEAQNLRKRTTQPGVYELYDLQSDPGELINLVNDPEKAAILKKLKQELDDWRRNRVKDPFVEEEVLKLFTEQYLAHCLEWRTQMYLGGKEQAAQKKKY